MYLCGVYEYGLVSGSHNVHTLCSTSAANSTENFQKNEHIAHRNARVTAEMQAFVDIIDVFNASLELGAFNHVDNVHMDAAYYATLARILHP